MKQSYTKEQINQCCLAYQTGKTVLTLSKDFNIPRSTIYSWLKKFNAENSNHNHNLSIKNYNSLQNKVIRLQGIIEILKSVDCTANSPLKIKLDNIERLYGKYSVHMLCEALDVSRGTFYNHILRNKRTNTWYAKRKEDFRLKIQQIFDNSNQIFGVAKITAILKDRGERISENTVRQLMQDMGLISIRQSAKDMYDKEQRPYKNYLNQQFTTTRPNEVWVSDITYFRLNNKNYYICVIIDLFARTVIGYRIGIKNSTQLVKSTFKLAYQVRKPTEPLIFHTDRGNTYRSKTFCSYLKSLNVTQSFSRAYVPYDNSVMESFFASLKREELYRTKYRSENEFRTAVDNYMKFYNEQRPHAKNNYKTPINKEFIYYQSKQFTTI